MRVLPLEGRKPESACRQQEVPPSITGTSTCIYTILKSAQECIVVGTHDACVLYTYAKTVGQTPPEVLPHEFFAINNSSYDLRAHGGNCSAR